MILKCVNSEKNAEPAQKKNAYGGKNDVYFGVLIVLWIFDFFMCQQSTKQKFWSKPAESARSVLFYFLFFIYLFIFLSFAFVVARVSIFS